MDIIFVNSGNCKKTPDPRRLLLNLSENRITFRIKTGYYPELLTLETMKVKSKITKSKITKDENG